MAARRGHELVRRLDDAGVEVLGLVDRDAPAAAIVDDVPGAEADELRELARGVDIVLIEPTRESLPVALVTACDRWGVRVVAVCATDADRRVAAMAGVDAVDRDADVEDMLASDVSPADADGSSRGSVIAVWGPEGAPGRSTIAVELACELARGGIHVALADADSHAPSIAIAAGLADEGPGFAAACRQAGRGLLTASELTRISESLGDVDVLVGLNRPSRWPELDRERVAAALRACREWAAYTVVDVAAPLEADEEIVSDLDGPRRNAATLAALGEADTIVAVVAADPVSVARFVRAYPDLRAVAPRAQVRVVVNKSRAGALGLDARGQVRRTLDRFAGIRDAWFVPWDAKSTDAALLAARPIAHLAPRSALTSALRRFVGEAIVPPREPARTPAVADRRARRGRARAA